MAAWYPKLLKSWSWWTVSRAMSREKKEKKHSKGRRSQHLRANFLPCHAVKWLPALYGSGSHVDVAFHLSLTGVNYGTLLHWNILHVCFRFTTENFLLIWTCNSKKTKMLINQKKKQIFDKITVKLTWSLMKVSKWLFKKFTVIFSGFTPSQNRELITDIAI